MPRDRPHVRSFGKFGFPIAGPNINWLVPLCLKELPSNVQGSYCLEFLYLGRPIACTSFDDGEACHFGALSLHYDDDHDYECYGECGNPNSNGAETVSRGTRAPKLSDIDTEFPGKPGKRQQPTAVVLRTLSPKVLHPKPFLNCEHGASNQIFEASVRAVINF